MQNQLLVKEANFPSDAFYGSDSVSSTCNPNTYNIRRRETLTDNGSMSCTDLRMNPSACPAEYREVTTARIVPIAENHGAKVLMNFHVSVSTNSSIGLRGWPDIAQAPSPWQPFDEWNHVIVRRVCSPTRRDLFPVHGLFNPREASREETHSAPSDPYLLPSLRYRKSHAYKSISAVAEAAVQ